MFERLQTSLCRRINADGQPVVYVHHKRWIAILQGALRAAELEKEVAANRTYNRASALMTERASAAGISPAHPYLQSLLEDPPQSAAAGGLHGAAFSALLDARLWDCRLDAVVQPTTKEA